MQWNLLKISLENFRIRIRFWGSLFCRSIVWKIDLSFLLVIFFIQFLEELGQLLSILKVFEQLPQTSVTSANFRKTGVPIKKRVDNDRGILDFFQNLHFLNRQIKNIFLVFYNTDTIRSKKVYHNKKFSHWRSTRKYLILDIIIINWKIIVLYASFNENVTVLTLLAIMKNQI